MRWAFPSVSEGAHCGAGERSPAAPWGAGCRWQGLHICWGVSWAQKKGWAHLGPQKRGFWDAVRALGAGCPLAAVCAGLWNGPASSSELVGVAVFCW